MSNLSPQHAMVLNSIPIGHANAIRRDALSRALGMRDREVRDVIEQLICLHHPVCNLGDGKGYFRPGSIDELRRYIAYNASYKKKLMKKEYHLKRAMESFDTIPMDF